MFFLFLNKKKSLVKKWKKEHKQIVDLSAKVIEHYNTQDKKNAKKYFKKLDSLVLKHIVSEDVELYDLLKNSKTDTKLKEEILEFEKSFLSAKAPLLRFLLHYTKDDIDLDEEFIEKFKQLIKIISKRIEFEENKLYKLLSTN